MWELTPVAKVLKGGAGTTGPRVVVLEFVRVIAGNTKHHGVFWRHSPDPCPTGH